MPTVSAVRIEYTFQDDGKPFAEDTVDYDKSWLEKQLRMFLSYWSGKRGPTGVDIEEAWKCRSCVYSDDCSWRIKKHEEFKQKNASKKKF